MSRRVIAILFILLSLVAGLSAATGTAPASAFAAAGYDPSAINGGLNSDNAAFFIGFQVGMTTPVVLPDNCAYLDWWSYIAAVRTTEMPRRNGFAINNYNVGVDSAEEIAAHYFFYNDPTAAGVIDCSARTALTARVRRAKQPMVQRHLDLVGKGVMGATKLVYKGARVIL